MPIEVKKKEEKKTTPDAVNTGIIAGAVDIDGDMASDIIEGAVDVLGAIVDGLTSIDLGDMF